MGCGASSSPDDIIVVRGAPTSGKVAQSKLLAVVPDRGATDRSGHGASEVKEIEVSTGVFLCFLVFVPLVSAVRTFHNDKMTTIVNQDPELGPRAAKLLKKLELVPHPEGGYYKEEYRSEMTVTAPYGERSAMTAIKFLVTPGSVSRFHKIRADEVWNFYEGEPLTVVELVPGADGAGEIKLTSMSVENPQYVVKRGVWFGSLLTRDAETAVKREESGNPGSSSRADFALVGCVVAPGFDFEDFELASRAKLLDEFPAEGCSKMILKLTEGLP